MTFLLFHLTLHIRPLDVCHILLTLSHTSFFSPLSPFLVKRVLLMKFNTVFVVLFHNYETEKPILKFSTQSTETGNTFLVISKQVTQIFVSNVHQLQKDKILKPKWNTIFSKHDLHWFTCLLALIFTYCHYKFVTKCHNCIC